MLEKQMGPNSFQKVIGLLHCFPQVQFCLFTRILELEFLECELFSSYFFVSFFLILRSFRQLLGESLVHPGLRNSVPERSVNSLVSFIYSMGLAYNELAGQVDLQSVRSNLDDISNCWSWVTLRITSDACISEILIFYICFV